MCVCARACVCGVCVCVGRYKETNQCLLADSKFMDSSLLSGGLHFSCSSDYTTMLVIYSEII